MIIIIIIRLRNCSIVQYIYFTEIMADIVDIKEDLGDFEVKEEEQDPLSLEPTQFTGKHRRILGWVDF